MFGIKECLLNDNNGHVVIGDNRIQFGWKLLSDKNDTVQKAYQIQLFNDKKEVLLDTGKVMSSRSINIHHDEMNLESRKEFFWQVTVWNNYDECAVSEVNSFETGLINYKDWKAKWIEADRTPKSVKENFNFGEIFSYHNDPKEIESIQLDAPLIFSKSFVIKDKSIKKARIYSTAHGVYELEMNGEKVGDEYFAPGFTTYSKLQYYQTHDVKGYLTRGENIINISVADGWYKGKIGLAGIGNQFGDEVSVLAQIEIEYEDGEKVVIGTDKSFEASEGKIEYSDLFIGEKQDHNKKDNLKYEVVEKNYGYAQIKADKAEPIRCIEKLKPVKYFVTPKGEIVLDFGRNIAGIVEVKVNGQKGDVVILQHTEELDADGNFFFNIIGQNKYQTTTFVLSGEGEEKFVPKFTYQGFRYVKVSGYPGEIEKDNFTAYVLSSDCKRSGNLKTSNEKINKLLENIYHSQESNFISVPTDCPQREKGGWTGDAQIYIPTAIFNMNIKNFMNRWLENMRLEQRENGQIPGLVPFVESDDLLSGGFGNISSAGWADACIIIPWNLYVQYEDSKFLTDNYEMMKRWLHYVEERCKSNVTEESKEYERYLWDMEFHYGDWMTPSLVNEDGSIDAMASSKATAKQVATMYFAHSAFLLAEISEVLGKKEDSAYYRQLSHNVKDAFIKAYVDKDGIIEGDMQGLYALALAFKMADKEVNEKFINRLTEKIKQNNNRLDTGFLGTPVLLDALSDNNQKDLAYALLMQEESPSWLYMVNKGATTIWETWEAIKPDGRRDIISYNHYSLGSVEDYIVRKIAGLSKVKGKQGEFILEPDSESPINSCSIQYDSPYGKIETEWNFSDEKKDLKIDIPVGATVILKLKDRNDIELRSGKYKLVF